MKCNNELRDDVECNGKEETVKKRRYDENAGESFTNSEYVHINLCETCVEEGKYNL